MLIFSQCSTSSIDNELQTLKIMIITSLSHHNRASHSRNEYCKNCSITTSLSPQAFDTLFKPYIHYFIVLKSGKMFGKLSPSQFMRCLCDASRSIISPESCIQARIFSVVKVAFWERSMDLYTNVSCPK